MSQHSISSFKQTFKNNKTVITKVNHAIFTNLLLLDKEYPLNNVIREQIHPAMFLIPKKAAFNEVIYYLLIIIAPEMVAQLIPHWPLTDIKLEQNFRKELSVIISKLQELYPRYLTNRTACPSSKFVSPGGKFISILVFQISQIALMKILTKTGNNRDLLNPPINSNQLVNLKAITNSIKVENQEFLEDYYDNFGTVKGYADNVTERIKNSSELLYKLKKELNPIEIDHGIIKRISDEDLKRIIDVKDTLEKIVGIMKKINLRNLEEHKNKTPESLNNLLEEGFKLLNNKSTDLKCTILSGPKVLDGIISNDGNNERIPEKLQEFINFLNQVLKSAVNLYQIGIFLSYKFCVGSFGAN